MGGGASGDQGESAGCKEFVLNVLLVETVEAVPDTVITLTNGHITSSESLSTRCWNGRRRFIAESGRRPLTFHSDRRRLIKPASSEDYRS